MDTGSAPNSAISTPGKSQVQKFGKEKGETLSHTQWGHLYNLEIWIWEIWLKNEMCLRITNHTSPITLEEFLVKLENNGKPDKEEISRRPGI